MEALVIGFFVLIAGLIFIGVLKIPNCPVCDKRLEDKETESYHCSRCDLSFPKD